MLVYGVYYLIQGFHFWGYNAPVICKDKKYSQINNSDRLNSHFAAEWFPLWKQDINTSVNYLLKYL